MARHIALIYNWWSLFVRAAHPKALREAITSRPLLLNAVARRKENARRVRLFHAEHRDRGIRDDTHCH